MSCQRSLLKIKLFYLELFTREDEPLTVRWNPFLVLNLVFNLFNRIGRFTVQRDILSGKSLDEDLHVITSAVTM